MTGVQEGFVEVGDHRIAYSRSGDTASVALIHGIPTSRYLWRKVGPVLDRAGLGWIAVDLLGYGDSSKPSDIDLGIASQAGVIERALVEMGWTHGTIVGHDIGGGVAQLLAANRPELIRHLVLVDTIAYDSFPEPGIARLKEPVWDAILGDEDFDLKKGLSKGLQKGMVRKENVSPEMVAEYERPFAGVAGRHAYLRAARALRSEDLVSRVQEIESLNIPTLIVWGAHDEFQPLPYGQRLAQAMRHARLVVLDDAGHFLPEDVPDTLGRLIAEFTRA
jgi:2-hydroxymuconate-semialdehyde hydrolase